MSSSLSLSRGERLLLLTYVGLTAYFTAPLLATGHQLGISDWDVLFFYHASVMKSVYEYGALPFWNPWYCGGGVLWQNPQVALFTPTYLFALFTSLALAMKLNIFLHYIVAFVGMHMLLTRALRLTYLPGVLFLASTFTLAGGLVFHLAVGHATFLPYFHLPWLLFFFLQAIETGRLRYVVGAGAVIALAICGGGIHMSFMAAVGLTSFSIIASIVRRDWRPFLVLCSVGVLAFLLAAPKLLPTQAYVGSSHMIDTRAPPPTADAMSTDMVLHAFLDPFQYRRLRLEGQSSEWHEYGDYIGSVSVLAILASLVWVLIGRPWTRDHWLEAACAGTAVMLLSLGLGELGAFAPYVLMHRLPVASQFRLPSRDPLVSVLFAVAMVASALRGVSTERLGDAKRFMTIVLVLATASLAYWNHIQFENVFPLAPLESSSRFLSRPAQPVVDTVTPGYSRDSPMLRAIAQNRALVQCYEPLQLSGGIDATRPMVFGEGGARIADIVFAPGRIQFRALSGGAGRLFLNERYVEGWHSDAGEFTLDSQTGLAYVALPPGSTGRFSFWFVPPGLVAGFLLCAVGIVLSLVIWRRTL